MSIFADVLTAAVPALVTAGAGILGAGAQRDQAEENFQREQELANQDQALQLRLAALKAQYAGGGGGGGAAKPDPNFISKADRVSAVAGQGENEQSAINNLITAIQNGYALAGRG